MQANQIELSTVAFYEGHPPRSLALTDCSWPMAGPPVSGICGVYGSASKPEAFMAARAHADREHLNFTVIDFIVEVESRSALTMKPQDLSSHDFFNLQRMSVPMGAHVGAWLQADKGVAKQFGTLFDTMKPEQVMMQSPALIDVLAATADCRHVKLFAFPAKTAIGSRPLAIGFVPFTHWAFIREATCRLDPTVHVTLDPPVARAKRAAKAAPKEPRPHR